VVTDAAGNVVARHDYFPFGQEIPQLGQRASIPSYSSADQVRQRFTGKERDPEDIGVDYFGARYFSPAQGRFTATDPIIVTPRRILDPQRLNAYAYVRNNPLRYIDPNGEDLTVSGNLRLAGQYLCQVLGTADCMSRITIDPATRLVTVDLAGIDVAQNEGARLLQELTAPGATYDLAVGPAVMTAGGVQTVATIKNLDRNPDDRFKFRKPPGKVPAELPQQGVDGQVAYNPQAAPLQSKNQLAVPDVYTIIFHELAEAVAKVRDKLQYVQAHQTAHFREWWLRQQRPQLQLNNYGSGGEECNPMEATIGR
jgi:RHS repeat-associated protein